MDVRDVRAGDDDDVAAAILDHVLGAGVRGAQVADVQPGGSDGGGVEAGAQELSNVVAPRVFADLVDGHPVATAVDLERHLAVLADRDFLGREMVDLVRARIGGTADGTFLKTREGAQGAGWKNPEVDGRLGPSRVFMVPIAVLLRR